MSFKQSSVWMGVERVLKALTSHIWGSKLARKPLENGIQDLEIESAPLIRFVRECLFPRQILVISVGILEVMGKPRLLDTAWSTGARPGKEYPEFRRHHLVYC